MRCVSRRQLGVSVGRCLLTLGMLASLLRTPVTAEDSALREMFAQHCFDCHQGTTTEAGVDLDQLINQQPWVRNRDRWQRVVQLIEMRAMPPDEAFEVSDADCRQMTDTIRQRLRDFDYSQIEDPGHEPIRRLTHREYEHTLNDLLGTRLSIVNRFPRELVGRTGFDNDAATLSLQAALMERYIPVIEDAVEQSSSRWKPMSSDAAARKALRRFLSKAYRRPASEQELEFVQGTYQGSRDDGQAIDASLKRAMRAALLSPSFLMRIETTSGRDARGISEYELASRLSYFLWASMPDDQLFRLATRGQLRDAEQLQAQIERMIADPKAVRFAEAFVGQWLSTDLIGREIRQDPIDQPWCTDSLMDAMREETSRLFLDLLRTNQPATQLIDASYTFATDELADTLYDLPLREGRGVHRLTLEGTNRRGVLGHAAVLAATSGLQDISVSKRGAFVLDRLLGDAPPPPPPNAGELDERLEENDRLSMSEKINRHASDRRCAGCHQRIDPIGAALRQYGPFGRRSEEEDDDADPRPTQVLADGTRLSGVSDLRRYILVRRRDDFVRNLVERVMEYALNRPLEYFDEPAVREVIARFEASDLRLQALIQAIATCYPFQNRREPSAATGLSVTHSAEKGQP